MKDTPMQQQPWRTACAPHVSQRGFTLIELMIVVTVVAILAALALPSYTEYIQRSHRSNARSALQQAAQWMERAATAQGSYPVTANVPAGVVGAVEGGRYTLTIVSTATTYALTATPTGAQSTDKCGNFTLNQAGLKGVSGTLSVEECWNR